MELILRGGESLGLEQPVHQGDRLAVNPMFEAFDVWPLVRLHLRPLWRPRSLADADAESLAWQLARLGFDALWHNDLGDGSLARLASVEHRILLGKAAD